MIKCPKCGRENPDNAKNCYNCNVNLQFARENAVKMQAQWQAEAAREGIPFTPIEENRRDSSSEVNPVNMRDYSSDVNPVEMTDNSSKVYHVKIENINMPFWEMVGFLIKLSFASIPAMFVVGIVILIFTSIFGGILAGIFSGIIGN